MFIGSKSHLLAVRYTSKYFGFVVNRVEDKAKRLVAVTLYRIWV